MMNVWPPLGPQRYWLTPAVIGALLILIGVLIYLDPDLLAYFIAAVFVLAGATLVGIAWQMRKRVTYRRIDETWRANDDAGDP